MMAALSAVARQAELTIDLALPSGEVPIATPAPARRRAVRQRIPRPLRDRLPHEVTAAVADLPVAVRAALRVRRHARAVRGRKANVFDAIRR